MASRYQQSGLTLLELLIASAIFLVISVAAYSGWYQVQLVKSRTDEQSLRLDALQRTFYFLTDDISQLINRPIRDEFGSEIEALQFNDIGDNLIEFTRAGWLNPAVEILPPRSSLQRVAYRLIDERLLRVNWYHLDRTDEKIAKQRLLIDGVTELTFKFLGKGGEWQTSWPPLSNIDQTFEMPRAIEVTVELNDFGIIKRTLVVPSS